MQNKIIWKNAVHSAKDYLIYLLTVLLSFSLLYAFNMLVFSKEIQNISSGLNVMTVIVVLLSIVVVWIMGWLIHYMARFMIEKRSREFGTYMLLGVPNSTIASAFVRENLLIGGAAFLGSLITGTLLYQMLAMIIVHLFRSTYRIRMIFSGTAVLITLLYVLMIYGTAMLRIRNYLKKVEAGELLYADRQNEQAEKLNGRNKLRSFFLFLSAEAAGWVLFLVSSYKTGAGWAVMLSIVMILAGIYGIYTSLTAFLGNIMLKDGGFKYGKDRLFLLRGLTAKLETIGKTLGTLALLLTMTLTATQLGILFEGFFDAQMRMVQGFEVAVSSEDENPDFHELTSYLDETYQIRWKKEYPLYLNKEDALYEYCGLSGYVKGTPVLGWSVFQELWNALGYDPVSLPEDSYLMVAADKIGERTKEERVPDITVGEKTLKFYECRTESFHVSRIHGTGYMIVVPDALTENLPVYHTCLAIQTENPVKEADVEKLQTLAYGYDGNGEEKADSISINADASAWKNSAVVIFSFSLFYIGLIFACTAAAILAVQQLSDAVKYQYRYRILYRLGMPESGITKLICKQLLVYFLVPACIPILASIFLAKGLNRLILVDMVTVKVFTVAAVSSTGLFLLIYLIYFAATYLGYKRKIMEALVSEGGIS